MEIFEVRDGMIAAGRDYGDLQQFERQVSRTPDAVPHQRSR
jgi:hypothetical protein